MTHSEYTDAIKNSVRRYTDKSILVGIIKAEIAHKFPSAAILEIVNMDDILDHSYDYIYLVQYERVAFLVAAHHPEDCFDTLIDSDIVRNYNFVSTYEELRKEGYNDDEIDSEYICGGNAGEYIPNIDLNCFTTLLHSDGKHWS